MIDIFLHAPTRQALADDLAPLGLAADGELAAASHGHALAVVAEDDAGVTVALRCLDEALWSGVAAAAFAAGTRIVTRPEGWRWAA